MFRDNSEQRGIFIWESFQSDVNRWAVLQHTTSNNVGQYHCQMQPLNFSYINFILFFHRSRDYCFVFCVCAFSLTEAINKLNSHLFLAHSHTSSLFVSVVITKKMRRKNSNTNHNEIIKLTFSDRELCDMKNE